MAETIYGVFNTLSEARFILGLIKKASWNKADLAVVYRADEPSGNYEIAAEDFLSQRSSVNARSWPGLKSGYLAGIGGVRFGSSGNVAVCLEKDGQYWECLKKELSENRIIVIIEARPEVTSLIRQLLTDTGNEIFVREHKSG